ncbi:hypothetical protein [Reichenbachiella sp.]|uniref:hypothetical protein n=1 Tax=Reichenbachiella sp. TaxID=2184521 RepID=UPI003B590632
MRYLNIIVILCLLNSCSNPNSKTSSEETPIDTVTVEQTTPTEPTLDTDTTAAEQETEEELIAADEPLTFDSAGRPSRPVFRNVQVDTSQLFGVWANEHSSPNAAFLIDKDKYYIADFDGDPVVPYILNGDSLTLFFEWGKQTSRISLPTPDLLIMSSENGLTSQYQRFEN